jgi:hypothetical protein
MMIHQPRITFLFYIFEVGLKEIKLLFWRLRSMGKLAYGRIDYDLVLEQVLKLCDELQRIPKGNELIQRNILTDLRYLNRYTEEKYGVDWRTLCRNKGYGLSTDVKVGKQFKPLKNLNLEDLTILWQDFYKIYNIYPTAEHCWSRIKNNYNLPTFNRVNEILEYNNLTYDDFKIMIGNNNIKAKAEKYDEYLKIFIDICDNIGSPLKYSDLTNNNYGLPDGRFFVNHCPDKNVKNYNQFLEWCGLKPRYDMSKEMAIKIIFEMQERLNRPLTKYDFNNPNENTIGISTINNHWGTLNKMKQELGLEINQEYMCDKSRPIERLKQDLIDLCELIYKNENRKILTSKDIDKCNFTLGYGTYNRIFKRYLNISVRIFLESIGFKLTKSGDGLKYQYDDNEEAKSQFEKQFSDFLRKLGLKYNKDYYRDIRYRNFIKSYSGLLDCDYIINYKDRTIYVEIAGILRDYKQWYLDSKPLNSKSKEKYRLKLMEKEKMLKENNLEYYILFPSDLQEDFLLGIFNKE